MKNTVTIKSNCDFRRTYGKGKVFQAPALVSYVLKNRAGICRIGITTSKKIGNAVNRNKHKRKLRAIIDNYKKLYVNNRDYIIILRGSAKDREYNELNQDFLAIMDNIRKDIKNEKEK